MTQIKSDRTYDEKVKDWWNKHFSSPLKGFSLQAFLEVLKKDKVQMDPISMDVLSKYQIFQIIEGDTLLVKSSRDGYCIVYPRHETFIKLIFPFEEDYKEDLLKEKN